jgi:hypothetical protein
MRRQLSPASVFESEHGCHAGQDASAVGEHDGRPIGDPSDTAFGVCMNVTGLDDDARLCLFGERRNASVSALDPFVFVGSDQEGRILV